MELTLDLYLTITARVAVLFTCGGYLFYKWAKAPRRYYFDLPFLMGVSFTAPAVSKIFDLVLYQMFYGEAQANQYEVGRPDLWLGHVRWLFLLVVMAPLLYANLRVWVSEKERARIAIVGAYLTVNVVLIFQCQRFAELTALVPYILLPVAAVTIVTFLFIYNRKHLPNVHGLLVGIGWAAYLVTNSLRPMLVGSGTGTSGYLAIAELLDMLAWLVIFAGFAVKPGYAKAVFYPAAKMAPVAV